MSETKFTKGPWEIDGLLVKSSAHTVCLMGEPAQYAGDIATMCSNYTANSHLIAAAPELYSENETAEMALREIANILEGSGLPGVASIARAHADRLASTAAKARGEPQ